MRCISSSTVLWTLLVVGESCCYSCGWICDCTMNADIRGLGKRSYRPTGLRKGITSGPFLTDWSTSFLMIAIDTHILSIVWLDILGKETSQIIGDSSVFLSKISIKWYVRMKWLPWFPIFSIFVFRSSVCADCFFNYVNHNLACQTIWHLHWFHLVCHRC